MSDREASQAMRAKILGVLIKDARLAKGKTIKDCADALGCTPGVYTAYEVGKKSLSLPQLELLAYFLDTPLNHFWSNETLTESQSQGKADLRAADLISLRDRMIGAKMRKARNDSGIKIKELAVELGISSGRLSAYEFGQKPIPIPELEAIAARLGLTIEHFLEAQGPIGEWDSTRRALERLRDLPPELREFISQPINETYLRLAYQLSRLSADELRGIAESLLDITY